MTTRLEYLKNVRERYLQKTSIGELAAGLMPRPIEEHPLEISLPPMKEIAAGGSAFLREAMAKQGKSLPRLSGEKPPAREDALYARNIENYVGLCTIPVGVAGPLRVNGLNARGDFLIPLATTEAALVASFHRGCKAITLGGGVAAACLIEKIGRAPIFIFASMKDALVFAAWVVTQMDALKQVAESTSRYAKLVDINITLNGQDVVLFLEYSTGDASGQNMVTIASDAVGHWLAANTPVPLLRWYIESNMSGDKKATALSFIHTRGKRVNAEARIPADICEGVLKARPEALYDAWKISMVASAQCGSIGSQSHYANGLTALFIATGQDAACTAEAAVGLTEYAVESDGSLLVSVCLPNLVLGTVGGGTGLPTQRECLELMDCYGEGKAPKLAEICAGMILAGEISITAAIAAGHFAQAHKAMARGPGK